MWCAVVSLGLPLVVAIISINLREASPFLNRSHSRDPNFVCRPACDELCGGSSSSEPRGSNEGKHKFRSYDLGCQGVNGCEGPCICKETCRMLINT